MTHDDAWATKKIIAENLVRHSGWEPNVKDPSAALGPQMFLYVWDMPTDWVWMCTAVLDSFAKLSQAARDGAVDEKNIRSGLVSVLTAAAEGRPPTPKEGLDWEEQLAMLLTCYAGGTLTYKAAEGFPQGGHFIVLNYRDAHSTIGKLRPFAAPGVARVPLSPEDLFRHKDQVVALDRKRHPEWFTPA